MAGMLRDPRKPTVAVRPRVAKEAAKAEHGAGRLGKGKKFLKLSAPPGARAVAVTAALSEEERNPSQSALRAAERGFETADPGEQTFFDHSVSKKLTKSLSVKGKSKKSQKRIATAEIQEGLISALYDPGMTEKQVKDLYKSTKKAAKAEYAASGASPSKAIGKESKSQAVQILNAGDGGGKGKKRRNLRSGGVGGRRTGGGGVGPGLGGGLLALVRRGDDELY